MRHFPLFIIALYLLVIVVGCKPQDPTGKSASGSQVLTVNESNANGLMSKTDDFLRSIEESGVKGIKSVLCSLGKDNSYLGANVLKGINALAVQGSVDFASLLSGGAGPINVRGAVEVVYWFNERDPQKIERHVHLIPSAGASSAVSGPLDFEVGVVYGCPANDPAAYGGYFASIGAMGAQINLGVDSGAIFERAFIAGLESSVPGDVNDNYAIDFNKVISILTEKGESARRYAQRRTADYDGKSVFAGLMREVRVSMIHSSGNWDIELDFLTKRGILFINGLYKQNSKENDIVRMLKYGKTLTKQSGESSEAYKLRVAGQIVGFNEVLDFIWGKEGIKSNLRSPEGVQQTLYSISGHTSSENKKEFEVAFNTKVYGSDGKMAYSVHADTTDEMKVKMLTDQTYGCKRQRERYPEGRFFRVYVNKQPWVYDCMGFGPNEKYVKGISSRIFAENQFKTYSLPELEATKKFYEDLEQMRYAARHGAMQVHDSFRTQKDLLSMKTGGIRPGKILSGCNSVTLDKHGLLNVGRLGVGALQSGASLFTKNVGGGLRSAVKTVAHHGSVSASLAHYYHIHSLHSEHHASAGWPIIRSVRALKNISCDQADIPSLNPENDTGETGSGH